jgi:hypothetical protein
MAELYDQHDKPLILDVADDAIVADAVAPVAAEGVAGKGDSQFTGIFMERNAF